MPSLTTITAAGTALFAAFYLLAPDHSSAPAYSDQLRCSSAPYLPTPSYGIRGAALTLCAEEVIEGRLADIYEALLDFGAYDSWNGFVVHVDGLPSTPVPPRQLTRGTRATLRTAGLFPAGLLASSEVELSVLRSPPVPPKPIRSAAGTVAVNAWTSCGAPPALLRTEHPNILTDLGDGTVRYVSYETMYGPVAWVIRLLLGRRLQAQFELQGHDLKEYIESRY